uniref:glucuronosyltransferase n=1 Tax=Acrobeloides nanus TaxID=290746 RepID=A0A914EL31_9BILA
MNNLCEQLLKKTDVIDGLKSENFDIYFGEQLSLCGTGLSHVLGIKIHLWVSSTPLMDYMSWLLAAPMPLSYVPTVAEIELSNQLTYYERTQNILAHLLINYQFSSSNAETTAIFRNFYGPKFPSVEEIARESPLTFVMTDEFVDSPRPTLHNIVHIGGLGLEENNQITEEPFKSELSKGQTGVIFISLGSNVATTYLPYEFKKNFIDALKSLPEYHFIMKIEKDDNEIPEFCKGIPNIYLTYWAPQTSILSNPRVLAFVTHGGYNSMLEVAKFGVPVLVLPFFGDQFRNGRVSERNGWGKVFNKVKLLHGSEEFLEAIKDVVIDESFKKNAKRTSKLIQTKPFSAAERLSCKSKGESYLLLFIIT